MAATTTTPPRLARYRGRAANHTAGIYADMTVDGPEIGTLVVVVDRAKNLPNLRTMGKQDPYCAARLGKEAKKTETDKRGGQTPRWDQELRFTVHESPDYRKIKVSVFNDDKRKTDLIGETWIELDELLRPGGGQGDAWHTLTVKGRYAGEIRIELTFYDSRPKVDKPRSRKQSNADSLSSDQRQSMLGPRQLPGARPLPPDPAAATTPQVAAPDYAGTVPVPQSTPRSYHTPPPRETQYHDMNSSGSRYSDHDQNDLASNDAYARPLPNPRMSQSFMHTYDSTPTTQASAELPASQPFNDGYDDRPKDYIPFSDDPYALEVAESRHGSQQDFQYHPQPSPPRHDRVQTLSGSPNPRPLPPIELPHAHSAPQLGPHERASEFDARFGGASNQHHQFQDYGSLPDDDGVYDSYETQSWSSSQNHHDVRQDSLGDCYEVGPPPPPVHRNSAPAIPKAAPRAATSQQMNTPTRALHMSTNVADFERSASEPPQIASPRGRHHMSRASYSPGHVSYQQHCVDDRFTQHGTRNNNFQPHLSPLADPSIRPRDEMAHDPRSQYNSGRYGSTTKQERERPSSYQGPQAYDDYAPPRPLSFHEDPRQPRQDGPPLIRPRAISPGRNNTTMPAPQQQQYRTPRKSVSPNPSPANTQSSTPYSPDSFDSLNPAYSNQSTPDTSNKFEPTPMYSSQESSPTKPSPLAQSSTPTDVPPLQINTRPRPHEGPILGSDGRIKDPSDHLPPSSYAPEPDRKEKRPSTIINIKSRFGPRDAREKIATAALSSPTSPAAASSPTDQRTQQQRQQQPRSPSGSSPLAPTHSSILNSNLNGGFNLSSPYPPPVPGKVPLGGYQSQVDEPDHFEMARLSLAGDDGYEGSEFGSAKSRHMLQGVRVRKSRWGA